MALTQQEIQQRQELKKSLLEQGYDLNSFSTENIISEILNNYTNYYGNNTF